MSPGIVLAVVVVLIGAQVTRLVVPGRGSYPLAVACAAAGLLGGELIALSGHGGPVLGAIHPLPDVVAIAALEAAGVILLSPRSTAGR